MLRRIISENKSCNTLMVNARHKGKVSNFFFGKKTHHESGTLTVGMMGKRSCTKYSFPVQHKTLKEASTFQHRNADLSLPLAATTVEGEVIQMRHVDSSQSPLHSVKFVKFNLLPRVVVVNLNKHQQLWNGIHDNCYTQCQQRSFSTNPTSTTKETISKTSRGTSSSSFFSPRSARKRRRKSSSSSVVSKGTFSIGKSKKRLSKRGSRNKRIAKENEEVNIMDATALSSKTTTKTLSPSIFVIVNKIYQGIFRYKNQKKISFGDCFKYDSVKEYSLAPGECHIFDPNKSTTSTNITPSHKTYWSCTFHCPITNQIIRSGHIHNEKSSLVFNVESRKAATCPSIDKNQSDNQNEKVIHQSPFFIKENDTDRCFYRRKRWALQACAARIFDHMPLHIKEQIIAEYDHDGDETSSLFREQFSDHDLNNNFMVGLATVDEVGGSNSRNSDNNDHSDEYDDDEYEFMQKRLLLRKNVHNLLSQLQAKYDPKMNQNTINRNTKLFSLEDDYKDRNIEEYNSNGSVGTSSYWRAEFTSPISKEVFHSGTIATKNKEKNVINRFGNVYYSKKKYAKNAALAKAMDCFIHRRGWTNSGCYNEYKFSDNNELLAGYENLCVEEPYDSSAEFMIPATNNEEKQLIINDDHDDIIESDIQHDRNLEGNQTKIPINYDIYPKTFIGEKYQSVLKKPIPLNCFTTVSKEFDMGENKVQYWTCTFECPVTGKVFKSGTLKQLARDNCQTHDEAIPISTTHDGAVYYFKKSDAVNAAAGRAADVLSSVNFFTSFGVNDHTAVVQFCEEDPFGDVDEIFDDSEGEDDEHGGFEEDDDDEFVIEQIPQAGSSTIQVDGSNNALQALLDAWADSFDSSKASNDDYLQVRDVVATANAWIDHMETTLQNASKKDGETVSVDEEDDKQVFGLLQSPVNTQSCNSVLRALGNVNQINRAIPYETTSFKQVDYNHSWAPYTGSNTSDSLTYMDASHLLKMLAQEELNFNNNVGQMSKSNPIPLVIDMDNYTNKIERLAVNIIKLMTAKINPSEGFCAPNIDTFNQYLRCVERQSPDEAASVVESYVNDIKEKQSFHGYNLKPNIQSFNTMMKFFIVANDHEKIPKLLLEVANDKTAQIRPNRDTFLLALHSFASQYKQSYFDPIKANKWIECIRRFAEQYPEDGLNVDIDIYNAILPWSPQSSDKSACDVLDSMPHCTVNSVKEKQLNAEKIEDWVNKIEKFNLGNYSTIITPNIRTYEAVIQAWSKVGVIGLPRAEEWIDKLLEKSASDENIKLRLGTFIPIIATWAQYGGKNGPDNVTKWIQKLDELSAIDPSLEPNGIIRSYLIVAQRNYQKNVFVNANPPITEYKQRLEVAEECYDDLLELIDAVKSSQLQVEMEVMPFMACADAWNETFFSSMNEKELQKSMQNLLQVKDSFNEFLGWWYRKCNSTNTGKEEVQDEREQQRSFDAKLVRLNDDSAIFYKKILFYLRQSQMKGTVGINFHHMESILRQYEMHNQHLGRNGAIPSSAKCLELYDEILEWCQTLNHPTQYGDAIRVAIYVLSMCNKHYRANRLSSNEIEGIGLKVIDVVCTVIPNDNEKILLLKKVIRNMDDAEVFLDNDTIRSVLPRSLDVSDILFSPEEEEIINKIIPKRKGRNRHQ